jgi:hypothetical protein
MPTAFSKDAIVRKNLVLARQLWPGQIAKVQSEQLRTLVERHLLSVDSGDVQLLAGRWYVTHSGLLRLADR